ncbi:MAG: AAA family ATPase, partial [Bacteroidia bacterium]|nr:AAA family ATPase [Bacteroidia bacterium]
MPSVVSAQKQRILDFIENNSAPFLFITGKAGSGKSTLIKEFCSYTKKRYAILAPTGIAALNVGGQTIHSFFRFPADFFDRYTTIKSQRNSSLYKNLELIIIDEISMVDAKLLDDIDYFMRKNGRDSTAPFGGTCVVAFGDLFQLPPVAQEEKLALMYALGYEYNSFYFFGAHIFKEVPIKAIELKTNYRQIDEKFLELLNHIRMGKIDSYQLDLLNQRYMPEIKDNNIITLTTTNEAARSINRYNLRHLTGKEYTYKAQISGEIHPQSYPTEEELILKPNAQVIFIKNDTAEGRWVNGTIGVIHSLDKDRAYVKVNNKIHEVEPVEWDKIRYEYSENHDKKIVSKKVGSFKQLPLRLAWAITIHKSQGQTFDKVIIDMGNRAFAAGQVYVALSRCTSLEGIYLKRPISRQEIFTDSQIIEFMNHL